MHSFLYRLKDLQWVSFTIVGKSPFPASFLLTSVKSGRCVPRVVPLVPVAPEERWRGDRPVFPHTGSSLCLPGERQVEIAKYLSLGFGEMSDRHGQAIG